MKNRIIIPQDLGMGDWVQFNDLSKVKSQINCISPHQRYVAHTDNATWVSDWNELLPVELTDEILLLNGWKYKSETQTWEHPDIPFNLKSYGEVDKPYQISISGFRVNLKYVHELQHVLKLVGMIDKAITFTVKR